jgi:hypothetical protein
MWVLMNEIGIFLFGLTPIFSQTMACLKHFMDKNRLDNRVRCYRVGVKVGQMDLLPNNQNFDLNKSRQKLRTGNRYRFLRKGINFPCVGLMANTK